MASVIFLIVLSAAQPQHLDTVWPVCIGIGIVLPIVALCCCGWQMLSSRQGRSSQTINGTNGILDIGISTTHSNVCPTARLVAFSPQQLPVSTMLNRYDSICR